MLYEGREKLLPSLLFVFIMCLSQVFYSEWSETYFRQESSEKHIAWKILRLHDIQKTILGSFTGEMFLKNANAYPLSVIALRLNGKRNHHPLCNI